MKPKKISHVGIAVNDLDAIIRIFEEKLGLQCTSRKKVEDQGIEVAVIPIGDSALEFLKPFNPDSPVGKFINKKGPGLHHVSLEVDDIQDWIEKLQDRGAEMVDKKPRTGARGCSIAFVHPKSLGGILIELEEE